MANLNSNGTGKEPGFLDHMKGALLTAFGMTPLGTALGLNPIINRPLVRTGINETTKDTVRDVGLAYKYLATFGDKQAANKTADEIEQIWRKNITQNAGMGQSEFRLGAGWKMPANTLYNGKIDKEREGKDLPVDAVFLRHKNGSIEVLDHSDPRYAELAMPYVIGQLAIPIGAGKAMAAIKFLSNGGKIVDGIVKGAELAGKTVSAVNTLGGLGYVGSMAANKLILTPDSINRVAHLFDNPNNFKPDNLREELNSIFEKYSYLNGPMSEQYYVPEVKPGQSPWQRLQDLSTGFAHRVFKSTTPFDRIEDLSDKSKHFCESVDLSEATAEIVRSIDFQRGFLKDEYICLNSGTNYAQEW